MVRGILSGLLIGIVACGGEGQLEDIFVRSDSTNDPTSLSDLPPSPHLPASRRGYLVAASAGDFKLGGEWKSQANLCKDIGLLEIEAAIPGTGTLILLSLKAESALGSYEVVGADKEAPEPGEARIGVQAFRGKQLAYAFQAGSGTLKISSFDSEVRGEFTSVVREVETDILTHYVGVFDRIPIVEPTASYCEQVEKSFAREADTSSGQ